MKIKFTCSKAVSEQNLSNITELCLSQNEYINKKVNDKIRSHKNVIHFIEKEIEYKQTKLNKVIQSGNTVFLGNDETATSLYKEKVNYEDELQYLEPQTITSISKPTDTSTSPVIITFTGLILGILLIVIIHTIKGLNSITGNSTPKDVNIFVYDKTA